MPITCSIVLSPPAPPQNTTVIEPIHPQELDKKSTHDTDYDVFTHKDIMQYSDQSTSLTLHSIHYKMRFCCIHIYIQTIVDMVIICRFVERDFYIRNRAKAIWQRCRGDVRANTEYAYRS